MTKPQSEFIEDVKQQRLRPDYAGSMYPVADDPHGEVLQAMKKLAKTTGMKFKVTGKYITVLNRKVNPSFN